MKKKNAQNCKVNMYHQLHIPAGELGVDELQLEVFDEESICIDGL